MNEQEPFTKADFYPRGFPCELNKDFVYQGWSITLRYGVEGFYCEIDHDGGEAASYYLTGKEAVEGAVDLIDRGIVS